MAAEVMMEEEVREEEKVREEEILSEEKKEALYIEGLKKKYEELQKQYETMMRENDMLQRTADLQRQRLDEQDRLIERLQDQAEKAAPERMLGKQDIMEMFQRGDDFALRLLRATKKLGYTVQLGKEYYISQRDFRKFLDRNGGDSVFI